MTSCRRWSQSIGGQLALALIVTAFAPVLIIGAQFAIARDMLVREAHARQLENTQQVAQEIEMFLSNVELHMSDYGRIAIAQPVLAPSIMRDLYKNRPFFRVLRLLDDQGNILLEERNQTTLTPFSLNEPDWFNLMPPLLERESIFRALRGEVYYGDVRFLENVPFIEVSLPIFDPNTGKRGVINAELDLQVPWDIVRSQSFNYNQAITILLLDKRGAIISTSTDGYPAMLTLAHLPPVQSLLSQAPQLTVYEYNNPLSGEVLGSSTRIKHAEWIILVERNQAQAYEVIYLTQRNAALAMIASLSVALLLTFTLRRRLLYPIQNLQGTAQRIAQGDLSAVAQVSAVDELGVLATGFNSMTERLIANIHALELAREKAEESTRLKSQFIATVSHELRTPLNAIEGFTDLLKTDQQLDARNQRMVERIATNSRRLVELVNDLLDLSRIEANRMEISYAPFSPRELADIWAMQVSMLAAKKNLRFVTQVDEALPSVMLGDTHALTKIGINLLSNAIKFTQTGEVCLRLSAQGKQWQIQVSDTGIGIPAEAHDYIFEEFRQVDASMTRQYEGTGLGLALVRRLAQLLEGQVALQSEVGKGSTFTVTLPVRRYQASPKNEAKPISSVE